MKSFMPEIPKGKKTVGSILLEHEYIDRDFLEDYSRFTWGVSATMATSALGFTSSVAI
ncbi:hypothetical protein V5O39_26280 [Pseudomonas parakoreensis]